MSSAVSERSTEDPVQVADLSRSLPAAESVAELEALIRRSQRRLRWLLHLIAALSALLIVLNVLTTAGNADLSASQRAWSIYPLLSLALVLAVALARSRWLLPRALHAQRRLASHRRLYGYDRRVRLTEERIRERLAGLPGRSPELDALLDTGCQASARLLADLQAGEAADEEAEYRLALLDAYRVALENLEIDSLLRPGFFQSPDASHALEGAVHLLDRRIDAQTREPVASGREHSIAVLPFIDRSPEQDQELFAGGLAEEIINALTKLQGLRVIARSSAFAFRDQQIDALDVGRKLGVDTVVEGSVRKAAGSLRITVQLIRVRDGLLLWSERYDRAVTDVFSVQDEITGAVIEQLTGDVSGKVEHSTSRSRTADLEAYHLYLRGRHFCNKRTPADLVESVRCFEAALAKDPGYALAQAGLADSLNLLGYYSVLAPGDAFPHAKQAALRALELDEELAEAHSALASTCLLYDWDWRRAGEEFARTFELNPGYATAHHWFAEYLAFLGRHEDAIEQARTALALDPLSLIINVLLGWNLYYARRYDEAIDQLLETLRLDPSFAPAELWLGLAYEQIGRFDDAARALEAAAAGSGRSPLTLAALGRLHACRGHAERAGEILQELTTAAERRFVPPYHIAAIHSGSGDREQTLRWLERACEERDNWMVFLEIDPAWDRYRSEPRFRALARRVGLRPESD